MAIMLSRRLLTLATLVILGGALVFIGLKTRPAASAETPPAQSKAATTQPLTANPATQDPFFAEYKMKRDSALSLEAALLRDVVQSPLSGAETRAKAQDELLQLSQDQARLVELEGLVHAEGFSDAAVFLENQGVTVVVGPGHISASKAVGLVGVLAHQAGVPPANVMIIQRP